MNNTPLDQGTFQVEGTVTEGPFWSTSTRLTIRVESSRRAGGDGSTVCILTTTEADRSCRVDGRLLTVYVKYGTSCFLNGSTRDTLKD